METLTSTGTAILHAFDWPYSTVAKEAKQIAKSGFKSVLVSPPHKSLTSEEGTEWWQRYQPQDYRICHNSLGDTNDFIKMVKALKAVNVQTYADIVFNHMANESYKRKDLNYPCQSVMNDYQLHHDYYESIKLFGELSEPLFTEEHFIKSEPITNWKCRWQVQNGRISSGGEDKGLPPLAADEHVIHQQRELLIALKGIGVKGFRIDAAKHISLEHIQRVWDEEICEDVHVFGEIITDGGATKEEYELFLEPYLRETRLAAYDFPLFQVLWEVFSLGKSMTALANPHSVGLALENSRAITFAITHDIPNNDVFLDKVLTEENELLAYCFILGRDGGVPLVYSDLNSTEILGADGKPRWQDAYKCPTLQAMIHFHNLMHGQGMQITECSDTHITFTRGEKGVVAINNDNEPISIKLPCVGYTNVLPDTCNFHSTANGEHFAELAPKKAMMLIIE